MYQISYYIKQTASPEASTILVFIECWGSSRQLAARSVSEMQHLPSLSGRKPALAADGVTSPRLPLPSAGCFICLRVLGKTLSKQLHQQPVDFPLSEPDERPQPLMKRPGSTNSSSRLMLVAS